MIEKIVTSLEVSKRLKNLGIVQESVFYWVKPEIKWPYGDKWRLESASHKLLDLKQLQLGCTYTDIISAFTVTELGAMFKFDFLSRGEPNEDAKELIEEGCRGCWDLTIDELNQNLQSWRQED
jgi:hypothetical protein